MSSFTIAQAAQYDGQEVQVQGWVQRKRSSGKKLHFLVVRDGTGILQAVLFKGECSDQAIADFEQLTQESAVEITGVLRSEERAPGGFELGVRDLKVLHLAESFPITPKEHGIEFLLSQRHLWLRSSRQWAVLRVRSRVVMAIHRFFQERGFVQFDSPILTGNACEGTTTLFETEYFDEGQKAYLSQSGQLYAEAGAMALRNVYVFGPTFRAEKSKTRKHLTEFWMIEPEMAFCDLDQAMDVAEAFVKAVVGEVLEYCKEEFKILERDVSELEKICSNEAFPRISYDEAIKILEKNGIDLIWGEDFGAPHETALGDEFKRPVFVHHMPAQIKGFYFAQSNTVGGALESGGAKYALGCDLIAPHGFGEIIGGGQREHRLKVLERQLSEHRLSQKDFSWYLDLRRYGSVPHSGFGLGLERFVTWLTNVSHVREAIPFPRMLNHISP